MTKRVTNELKWDGKEQEKTVMKREKDTYDLHQNTGEKCSGCCGGEGERRGDEQKLVVIGWFPTLVLTSSSPNTCHQAYSLTSTPWTVTRQSRCSRQSLYSW
jgi:hypothetical protein